jgi:glycosyltransferase involved in cell wall biosynthesis
MSGIGVVVVAYNAAATLGGVLDRIPVSFRPKICEVIVSDDASEDETVAVGLVYLSRTADLPITLVRQDRNLGYGGNQKACYRLAMEHGLEFVVLLHGDGQYAPELLPMMVEPLVAGDADAVLGSRMLDKGAARAGGMPLYKFVGNKILSRVQNAVVGTELSEWHSGYRAYRVSALAELPLDRASDDFHFDTEILLQLMEAGKRIVEVPIPTYYGDEICYVNGLQYAGNVTKAVVRYRAHRMGLGRGDTAFASDRYEAKHAPDSSHGEVVSELAARPRSKVLDLGCADGLVAERLRAQGHTVVGVDIDATDAVKERVDRFVAADLDRGMPPDLADEAFDVVIAADVFEHLRDPQHLLDEIHAVLADDAIVLVTVPNFAHWYPRARVAIGRFDYDRRGILDRGHVRFFTRRSFIRLARESGYDVVDSRALGIPFEVVDRGANRQGASRSGGGVGRRLAASIDRAGRAVWPTLFAYQWLFVMRARRPTHQVVGTGPHRLPADG